MTNALTANYVYRAVNLRQSGDIMKRNTIKIILLILALILVLAACNKIAGTIYSVDESSCIGCGECLDACPHNAIIMENNKAVIIQSKCQGCGKCLSVCPQNAIH